MTTPDEIHYEQTFEFNMKFPADYLLESYLFG
jgi:hypothetical protein